MQLQLTSPRNSLYDDMDILLTLLGVAGCSYIMGVPGADDIMLAYQSSSFHDALYLRRVLGLRPAPEFEAWLNRMGIFDGNNALSRDVISPRMLRSINELSGTLSAPGEEP